MSGATAKKESMRLCIALGLRSDARVCHNDNNDWSSPLQCYADWRMIGHGHLCGWTGTRHSLRCNQAYDCGQHHFRAVRDGAPEGIDQTANGEKPDPESVPWVRKKPLAGRYTSESFSPSRTAPRRSANRRLASEPERTVAPTGERSSAAKLCDLLGDDFVEFGSSGRVFNKSEIIASRRQEYRGESVEGFIADFSVRWLAPNTTLPTDLRFSTVRKMNATHCVVRSGIERWQVADVFSSGHAHRG
jgi:hypothetical protein